MPCQTVGPWLVRNPQAKAARLRAPASGDSECPVWNTLTPTRTTTKNASVASGTQGARRRRQARASATAIGTVTTRPAGLSAIVRPAPTAAPA